MTNSKQTRTGWVIIITFVTMVVEITAGIWTGSMSLLADGWHMATHVGALSITWGTYYLSSQDDFRRRFTFGGGKILSLGAYTSAVVLFMTALWMVAESVTRFVQPVELRPWEAIWVTLGGLVINLISMAILGGHDHSHGGHSHSHSHDHKHNHKHDHKHSHVMVKAPHQHGANCNHDKVEGKDLNMESAYTHVMADAMTSVLALAALGGAIWLGWTWLDPLMGIVGAALILRWGFGLMRAAGQELLDARSDKLAEADVKKFLNSKGLDSSCVHVWQLDSDKLALHLRVNAISSEVPEVKNLRKELLARFPVDHLVLEISTGAADCQLV